MGLS
jgi:hypothetical protein